MTVKTKTIQYKVTNPNFTFRSHYLKKGKVGTKVKDQVPSKFVVTLIFEDGRVLHFHKDEVKRI